MVSSDNLFSYVNHEVPHCSHHCSPQAWIKEDENRALDIMQDALNFKRKERNGYIKFISHFGPALTGTAFWNTNKTTKLVSELLTITDEAFIHLCIINYSATWKAQEKKKSGETDVQVPVSDHSLCLGL
jgi:tRNA isopentenyl-2-thiomethyl-A-37 hydroxylase MiaE